MRKPLVGREEHHELFQIATGECGVWDTNCCMLFGCHVFFFRKSLTKYLEDKV